MEVNIMAIYDHNHGKAITADDVLVRNKNRHHAEIQTLQELFGHKFGFASTDGRNQIDPKHLKGVTGAKEVEIYRDLITSDPCIFPIDSIVFVKDAAEDPTVKDGWALYIRTHNVIAPSSWVKITDKSNSTKFDRVNLTPEVRNVDVASNHRLPTEKAVAKRLDSLHFATIPEGEINDIIAFSGEENEVNSLARVESISAPTAASHLAIPTEKAVVKYISPIKDQSASNAADIININAKIKTDRDRMSAQDVKIASNTSDIDKSKSDISAIEIILTGTKQLLDATIIDLDTAEQKITNQQNSIDEIKSNISGVIEVDIDRLKTDIIEINGNIIDVQVDVSGLHANINTINGQLVTLKEYVDSEVEDILNITSGLRGDINQLTASLQNTTNRVTDLEDRTDTIDESLQQLTTVVQNLSVTVANNKIDTDTKFLDYRTKAAQDVIDDTIKSGAVAEIDAVQANLETHIDDTTNPHNVTQVQVGLGNVNNTSDANKPVSTAQAAAISAAKSELSAKEQADVQGLQTQITTHIDDTTNPHHVTQVQVGLGNVNNTADSNKPVSTAQAAAISAVKAEIIALEESNFVEVHGEIDDHKIDINNPHQVNQSQVGLDNVNNTADMDKPVSTLQASAILNARTIAEDYADDILSLHATNVNNPHNVTKAQVGLSNVTNTADKDKPVSAAQQAAIDSISSGLTTAIDNHVSNTTIHTTATEKSLWNAKQSALVSGINIKSVNGASILQPGDLSLQPTIPGDIANNIVATSGTNGIVNILTRVDVIANPTTASSANIPSEKAVSTRINTTETALTTHIGDEVIHTNATEKSTWNAKQAALVSGTTIKTINGTNILGSGDISIVVPTPDAVLSNTSTNAIQNKAVKNALDLKQNIAPAGIDDDIVSYSGVAGVFDSLSRVESIRSYSNASNFAIPTEKAVAYQTDALQTKFGLYRTITDQDIIDGAQTPLTSFTAHTGNTDNPHNVTKAQVGLSNVTNTADKDKPISDATAIALGEKQNTLVSGVTLKTVGGVTLLGAGDVPFPTFDNALDEESVNAPQNSVVTAALSTKQNTLVSGFNISTINGNSILQPGNIALQSIIPGDTANNIVATTTVSGKTGVLTRTDNIRPAGTASSLYIPSEKAVANNILAINATFANYRTAIDQDEIDDKFALLSTLDNHIDNTANPHLVTKTQVGLGLVDNTSDINKPISNAAAFAFTTIQNNLNSHKTDLNNPHSTTAEQVGTYTKKEIEDRISQASFSAMNYIGVISITDPTLSGAVPAEGDWWLQTSETTPPPDTAFVAFTWVSGSWSQSTYNHRSMDLWSNYNVPSGPNGWYWFNNEWNVLSFDLDMNLYRKSDDQDLIDATKVDKTIGEVVQGLTLGYDPTNKIANLGVNNIDLADGTVTPIGYFNIKSGVEANIEIGADVTGSIPAITVSVTNFTTVADITQLMIDAGF
jgi:hypothetical protein